MCFGKFENQIPIKNKTENVQRVRQREEANLN